MKDLREIAPLLRLIDGRGYKAYKELTGTRWRAEGFDLCVDHVQGDPFAAPSRLRAIVPHEAAGFPAPLYESQVRRVALADLINRAFAERCRGAGRRRGSGKSGEIGIDRPGQEVLARTAVMVGGEAIEIRFTVGLPAAGRRVLAREARELLLDDVPRLVRATARYEAHDSATVALHVETIEDARRLREHVRSSGLVGFVADGAILPRRSGVDPAPMSAAEAIPFSSPDSLRRSFELPNRGEVSGMGVPRGVTLIVGGGYHGKSTLLSALELGVYDHPPGDGRELVVSEPGAVKVRAEDGRRVERVDISPFIGDLPRAGGGARDTRAFSTEDASGSTSQAANLMEALEAGAGALLVDEDTAATNFMIRDRRMQELVAKEREPITPFVDKVRQLYDELGVSVVAVMGGSGDYFDVADTVIAMEEYRPLDVTERAKQIAREHRTERRSEGGASFGAVGRRSPLAESLDPAKGRYEAKIGSRGTKEIIFGRHTIDLSAVGQLVATSQLSAIGRALYVARERWMDGERTIGEILDELERALEERGLDLLDDRPTGDYARFRRFELAAALNRLRTLRVKVRVK